jgi:isoleucyl-tRNA synthetase
MDYFRIYLDKGRRWFYADYEPTKAARAISDFVQENLSNWYVRLCRRRFWKGEYAQDKIAAYQTLYTCLLTVSKLEHLLHLSLWTSFTET